MNGGFISDITFYKLLNEWLLLQKGVVKDFTHYSYKSRITSMIKPILGEKNMTEMTAEDILEFNDELQKNGKAVRYGHQERDFVRRRAL